jgi:hypothetical protein
MTLRRLSAEEGMEPMAPHKFKVGDIVAFKPAVRFAPSGVFEVIKQLPGNDEHEYRIKSPQEDHQRVARESELTRVLFDAARARPAASAFMRAPAEIQRLAAGPGRSCWAVSFYATCHPGTRPPGSILYAVAFHWPNIVQLSHHAKIDDLLDGFRARISAIIS